ncbi:MAG: Mov34/MPN/PAD-1 family protein [Candidatus Methylomirabilales bacterium]
MEVYLSENAFIGLLVSTVEVYRRECFGILLGHSTPDRVYVEFAVPYQTANRKYRKVHIDWKRSQRVEEAVHTTTRWQCVGDYHSHPMYGTIRATTQLSKEDKQYFTDGTVGIVVAVNDTSRSRPWSYVKGGTVSGSINGYSIRIAAHYRQGPRIEKVPVVSPYAIGFMEKQRRILHEPQKKNGHRGR